ncbi:MAG: nucleotide pyrophosphatase/phosphodiesterase family protein, partial [Myxococcota bacterium]
MKTLIPLGFLLASITAGLGCSTAMFSDPRSQTEEMAREAMRAPGPPKRVVLITVGGLESADFLNSWGHTASATDQVRMPHLARLGREGVIGLRARPPSPSAVATSHATLVTGLRPTRHGVIADQVLDRAGNRALPYRDSRLIEGTTLWDAAVGRGVLALGWPTTVGARIELVVPGGAPSVNGRSWLEFIDQWTSPQLMHELLAIAAERQEGLSAALAKQSLRNPNAWPSPSQKDAAFIELACRVADSERDPGLWLIRLDQTVHVQRQAGYASVEMAEALGRVDAEIGRLVDCLGAAGRLAETAIFVTGDVAYREVHTQINPNVVLVREGLIGRDPRAALGVRSWLALVRSNGRSAYVYARDADSALEARKWLTQEATRTAAFEIVSAAELAASGADPQAWFGLAASPGFAFGNGLMKPILRPAGFRGSAGAFPFLDPQESSVGFVAWGRGIRPRIRVPSLD